jgi:hypothetical protein
MSAIGGKADFVRVGDLCLLMTQSGLYKIENVGPQASLDYQVFAKSALKLLRLEESARVRSLLNQETGRCPWSPIPTTLPPSRR